MMLQGRKRKNSDGGQRSVHKRYRDSSRRIANQTPEAQDDSATCGPLFKEALVHLPSTYVSPQQQLFHTEDPGHSNGKDFYVYRFLNVLYSSYTPPEKGTSGPVELFTSISYPGDDDNFYELDAGQVMPEDVVEEHNLYNAALEQLGEGVMEDCSPGYLSSPCRRASLPYPPSPESQRPLSISNKDKGKARYVPSEREDRKTFGTDGKHEDFLLKDTQQDLCKNTDVGHDESGQNPEPVEDAELTSSCLDNSDQNACHDVEEERAGEEGDAPEDDEIPDTWKHKGGRPPKAFIKKAAAVAEAYLSAVAELMSTFKVSQKVVFIATGLQPRKIETRETSAWNAHQRIYKIEHPKVPGESVEEFKTRQRLDYNLHIKTLTKDEKTKYRDDCEQTIMDYFFSGSGNELKTLSPAKRVDAACKALQKLAQMISRADHEIQSFGGTNYIGPDKVGRASGGATFISSNTVMKAIKMFDIRTSSIMVTTGDFLQAVVAQEEMNHSLGARSSVASISIENSTKNRPGKRKQDAARKDRLLLQEEDGQLAAGVEVEPPYVTLFKASDSRKKGRGYLGLTYHKVNGQRTTIDWIKLLPNSIKGEFRLINWTLSPHPGETEFAAEKIPAKFWQEIGKKLTADDFHPVTGGCHPTAPRFVPWTEEEKKLRKGTEKYNDIAIIVSPSGAPLLTIRQAEQPRSRSDRVEARAGPVGNEEEPHGQPESQNENQNVNRPSDKLSSTARSVPKKPLPAAPLRFEALDTNAVRREASRPDKARKEGFQTATPPLEALPHSLQPTHPPQQDDERQTTYRRPHQHSSTVISNRTTVTATSSRDLPQRGELGSTQHKKLVFSHPTARIPEVASATHAFYSGSNPNPPSNRGLSFPKPKPKPKPSAPQAGPPRAVAGSSKQGQNISQDPVIVRTSSRRPAAS